ncbi:Protein of unknown function DUF829 TMEM53 [Penicillium coprophilum]|uniref:Protein of unknown function DUF829 TMEM53 n=1 Tax=Penicillium coprophilum TaxID=36646 RepID=UPI002382FD9B|nr:Protein of unknown function DUF829 TMEM53 [Penicillium coprophilum]KAJ5171267.1 Protein of unknown function DUF829 TMEM53 [Penicillium coprophilum]
MTTSTEIPLPAFVRLAPSVYLQDPSNSNEKADRPVIFLAFWMNAPPRALAKYVVEYRRLVPSARIMFVTSSSNDFIWRLGTQSRRARVAPAVEAMRGLVTPENPVFVHFFSNGGMSSTTHLLQTWKNATGTPLPLSGMILDSAPGSPSLRAGLKAFSFALPRMWILRLLDPISLARKLINDTSLMRAAHSGGTLSRCYIYSDTDDLVDWRDVESHAANAEAEGWAVRRESFKNSPHVGHMRAEPDRYWGIVREYLGDLVSV